MLEVCYSFCSLLWTWICAWEVSFPWSAEIFR